MIKTRNTEAYEGEETIKPIRKTYVKHKGELYQIFDYPAESKVGPSMSKWTDIPLKDSNGNVYKGRWWPVKDDVEEVRSKGSTKVVFDHQPNLLDIKKIKGAK